MNSLNFWPRRNGKDSFDREYLHLDLFSHLSWMSAVATAPLSRQELFSQAAEAPYMSAQYFRKIHFLAQQLNYDYAQACRLVGEETREDEAKELLLRLAGSLTAGEAEAQFLTREARVMGEIYGDGYERQVESLRNWTHAYVALMMSAAMVITISVISMIFYPLNAMLVSTLAGLALFASLGGAWLLHRVAPKEHKTHSLPVTSREQELSRRLARVCLPAGVAVATILAYLRFDVPIILLASSVFVVPPGLLMVHDDRKIDKRDVDIGGLLRSLGAITKAIGTTFTETLSRVNLRALGSLEVGVRRLHSRLFSGLKPDLCWIRFIAETGSELVNRATRIFWDGTRLGGDSKEVGEAASNFALKIMLLRAKRKLVATSFTWLCIVMHTATAGLMVLIYEVMSFFSGVFTEITPEEPPEVLAQVPFGQLFASVQMDLLHKMMLVMIVLLTGTNAFAITATQGGHRYKTFFYLGLLMAISGAILLGVPQMAAAIFKEIPTMSGT